MRLSSWSSFKTICITRKSLNLQYTDLGAAYSILGPDANQITWKIILPKKLEDGSDNPDATDFLATVEPNCNKSIIQLDSDGASMSRVKVAPSGWNFQFRGIEFTTSTLDSVINKDAANANLSDATLKLYNSEGTLITAAEDQGNCVKTILDIEPPYDIYVAGGKLRMLTLPAEDIRMSVMGVPDVPANMGGSKPFIQNINLKFLSVTEGVNADGRAAKWLQYNATYHTNKIRFIFYHSAGFTFPLSVFMEVYKL